MSMKNKLALSVLYVAVMLANLVLIESLRHKLILGGMIAGVLFVRFFDWSWKKLSGAIVLLAFSGQIAQGQLAPEPNAVPAYAAVNYSCSMDLPPLPGQERAGGLVIALCAAVAAEVVILAAVKVVSICLQGRMNNATNPANTPFQAQAEPSSPVPVPSQLPPTTSDCQCGGYSPAPGPLPLKVQHSFDETNWTDVAQGVGIGSQFVLPTTGYWRLVQMPLSISVVDGVPTIHAPPGTLEFSTDLREWTPIGVNRSSTDTAAQAGFYRVRM